MGVQITTATKNGKGFALPFTARQFISFSYGGKNIEDFDLIAVFPSDRLEKGIYSDFRDITSSNDITDGQIFWKSVFQANKLNFKLATDGMSSENYEEFKRWFKPGQIRELILSEFSNRAIMARVSSAPMISLLPFEEQKNFTIGESTYNFSTSIYKGEIDLEFVMDDPHWYAKTSYFSNLEDEKTEKGDIILYQKDKIKIIYEDKIPALPMFSSNYKILLGENYIYNNNNIEINNGQKLTTDNNLLLYNCGTASTKPILSFSILPVFHDEYINYPASNYIDLDPYCNSYIEISIAANSFLELDENAPSYVEKTFTSDSDLENKIYSSLEAGSQIFRFTTPNLYTSYNYIIKLFREIKAGDSILDLRKKIRDEVHNYYTRAYAIALIDAIRNFRSEGAFLDGDSSELLRVMGLMFRTTAESENGNPITIIVNSKIGMTTISTKCRIINQIEFGENGFMIDDNGTNFSIISVVENAGDMVKSKYLQIEDRTVFSASNTITANECLQIKSSCELSDLKIDFKYYYL